MTKEKLEVIGSVTVKRGYLVAEIDGHELACIIAEQSIGITRPAGKTAQEAMQGFDEDTRKGFYKAAWAAASYVSECITKAAKVN